MLNGMERGVSVPFEEAQHVVAPHKVQLAGLHGFNRQLVPTAGNHRVQSQNFTGVRDTHNQRLALARGGGKLNPSLTEDENSPGTLSFDQNHRVFRKNRGVFNSVESLDRLR
jgi:hypothetical protein